MRAKEFIRELTLPKGNWVDLNHRTKDEASDELVDLVQTAYNKTPQGSFINSKQDVAASEWIALDWDHYTDIDTAIFYRYPRANETWTGYKLQGVGHDGQHPSKAAMLDEISKLLNKRGWWVEASDALRAVLLKRNCPVETDVEVLRTLFNDRALEMQDDGSYNRRIAGQIKNETVFGRPTV